MTDTEILNSLVDDLKWHVTEQRPISPSLAGHMIRLVECGRKQGRDTPNIADGTNWPYKKGGPYPSLHEQRPHFDRDITGRQGFWRRPHHPSALVNHYGRKSCGYIHGHCEYGCDNNELTWYNNGTHGTPVQS